MPARATRFPTVRGSELPWVTGAQMREIDRIATEELGLGLALMMENAGGRLAELAIARFGPRSAVVLAGGGANGGGGIVAARHLANRGARVRIVLDRPAEALTPRIIRAQLEVARRLEVEVSPRPPRADLVIDALIGYGLVGHPRGRTAELIGWAERRAAPVLALDVPSGLDATTGREGDPCIRAAATLTLAAPKTGLSGAPAAGELYLADISVPPVAFRSLGLDVGPIFARATILRVVGAAPRAARPARRGADRAIHVRAAGSRAAGRTRTGRIGPAVRTSRCEASTGRRRHADGDRSGSDRALDRGSPERLPVGAGDGLGARRRAGAEEPGGGAPRGPQAGRRAGGSPGLLLPPLLRRPGVRGVAAPEPHRPGHVRASDVRRLGRGREVPPRARAVRSDLRPVAAQGPLGVLGQRRPAAAPPARRADDHPRRDVGEPLSSRTSATRSRTASTCSW